MLAAHIDRHQLGLACAAETGFILSRQPDTVRAPDVSFISRDRMPPQGGPEGYWDLAPDLAVKVVSPSDSASDVRVKIQELRLAPVLNRQVQGRFAPQNDIPGNEEIQMRLPYGAWRPRLKLERLYGTIHQVVGEGR